jgi:ketosteroid isomerase-like protein
VRTARDTPARKGEPENRQTVERLVAALNAKDLDLFDEQFHEDSVLEYPQSGERVVGEG